MGLLDSYFDPEQFEGGGGLIGRLLSLQQMQGQYRPSAGFNQQISADNGHAVGAPLSLPMPQPTLPAFDPPTPDYGQTQNVPLGDYQMPQFGRADVSQAVQQLPDFGDRLRAGFQSWAHTPVGNPIAGFANGIAGLGSGKRSDPAGLAQQIPQPRVDSAGNTSRDLNSYFQALRPILGEQDAMLAIVHPAVGRTLITQALERQQKSGNTGDADPSGNQRARFDNEASSIAGGQPPSLSKAAYLEIPSNANQAFGELSEIQERSKRDTVSREDHVSGVREGNVSYNSDGSLDVTNGTVVTFSYKDGRAKTVTVTNNDIAHIDGKTGEVVIQKSPLGNGI